jgi:DNA-binding NtrC family response regulator
MLIKTAWGIDMSQNKHLELEHSILLVDDDAEFLDGARRALLAHDISNVTTLQGGYKVLQALATGAHNVLLLDWVMPDLSGADLLPEVIRQFPNIPVIIITGVSDLDNVVSCIKQGAYDYITKPIDSTRLVSIVQNAVKSSELVVRNRKLTGYLLGEPLSEPENFRDIITSSDRMMSIFKVIETLSSSRQPVLITGETGVGKELIAEAIHKSSGLKGRMVTVNAAGLDDTMLADTLFGHKKGAFTGATDSRDGLIEQAKGGTLFLDEIGDLCSASQIKLLRLLEQNEYYRVGSDYLHKSDARIITASNASFPTLLASGAFRSDLFYRISVHALHIPPLRERPEDIVPLVQHCVKMSAKSMKIPPPVLSKDLFQALKSYDFPGNVREMINMVHNAVAQNRSRTLEINNFPKLATNPVPRREIVRKVGDTQFALHATFPDFPTINDVEALLVDDAITLSQGNRSAAAKMLGVSRPTLQKKLEQAAEKAI